MSIDDSELREYTHGLFGSMSGILKQDFQPFLATCVAAALASCEQVSQQQPLSCLTSHTHTRMYGSCLLMHAMRKMFSTQGASVLCNNGNMEALVRCV